MIPEIIHFELIELANDLYLNVIKLRTRHQLRNTFMKVQDFDR